MRQEHKTFYVSYDGQVRVESDLAGDREFMEDTYVEAMRRSEKLAKQLCLRGVDAKVVGIMGYEDDPMEVSAKELLHRELKLRKIKVNDLPNRDRVARAFSCYAWIDGSRVVLGVEKGKTNWKPGLLLEGEKVTPSRLKKLAGITDEISCFLR